MPLGDFVEPGTIEKPLTIGRFGRFIFGLGTLLYLAWLIINSSEFVGSDLPNWYWWFGAGFAFWYFSDLVVVGFTRNWGRWPQVAVIPIALALVVSDLAAYGSAWGPPLGWGVFLFTTFYYGFIGVSFLLGGIFAVPG